MPLLPKARRDLAALRQVLAAEGLSGFLIPRADVHQGEYVAARDERLQWLTGFTGSAGFCIVLPDDCGRVHRRALPHAGQGSG